ncbi:hypothetical protein ACTFIW_010375 [Dictyostelium discoideum]
MDCVSSETLFFKIIRNVYLFKKILNYLSTTNKYYNNKNNIQESIKEINLLKVRKYENIISVDWMIQNKYFYLLKWKLNDNNSNLKFPHKMVEKFCMNFSDSFPLELFKDIYSKIGYYFIDDSDTTLFHFLLINRLDIIKFLIIDQSEHFKINLNLSIVRNLDTFKFLFNIIETKEKEGCNESKEMKLKYLKNFLPTISSQIEYSKEFIEYALKIYKSSMDENGINNTMFLGDSIFNIIINFGDYRIFLEYLVPIGYYFSELFSKLFYNILYKLKQNRLNSISIDHLLILEYIRIQIITEQSLLSSSEEEEEEEKEKDYIYIDTKITNTKQFFIEPTFKEFEKLYNKQNYSNTLESELLDENKQPIEMKIKELSLDKKKLFQFFINYFKESIISNFKQTIITNGGRIISQQLSLLHALKSYLQMAIDLEDLQSLKFLIALFNTNRLSLNYNLYSECLEYIFNSGNNNIDFISNFSKEAEDILSFLLENHQLEKSYISSIIKKSSIKPLQYLCSSEYNSRLIQVYPELLFDGVKFSTSISFIKYLYYNLKFNNIQDSSGTTEVLDVYCRADNHDLFEIIKFANENIIKPQPLKIQFDSLLINKIVNHKDGLKICKYLLGGEENALIKQYLLTNISILVSTISNNSKLDMLEYILSIYWTIYKDIDSTLKTECFLIEKYWNTAENDDVIRYLFSKNPEKIPYIHYESMISSNNVNLYKLSTQYRHLPSKQAVWSSISIGHLNMSLFLINDYIDRNNLKTNETIIFLFTCIENAITSRLLKLTQILISMIHDKLEKESPPLTLSETQIRSLIVNSVNSQDLEIFKFIFDKYNLDNSDIKKLFLFKLTTKSMNNYLEKKKKIEK